MTPGRGTFIEPFHLVEKGAYTKIQEILKMRLTTSAHVYNMSLLLPTFPGMYCYSLDGNLDPQNALIMIILQREDYGQDINLSLPPNFEPTEELKEALISTKIISWKEPHFFPALDRRISFFIFDISSLEFCNSATIIPANIYTMDVDEAKKLESPEGLKLQKLDPVEGHQFLSRLWKYSRPGTDAYMKKLLEDRKHSNLSAGVYIDGKPVCGVLLNAHGLIGCLGAEKEHKDAGYGREVVKYLVKEMAKDGFIPMSSSSQENHYFIRLHEGIGMKVAYEGDYILHVPLVLIP